MSRRSSTRCLIPIPGLLALTLGWLIVGDLIPASVLISGAVLAQNPDDSLRSSAQQLNAEGEALTRQGRYDQALEKFQQALKIVQEIGDRRGEAAILGNLGNIYLSLRQPDQALVHYQESLIRWRALGIAGGEAQTLLAIGYVHSLQSEPQKAIAAYEQALPRSRQAQNPALEAQALYNLGTAYRALNQPMQALTFYEQALPLFRRTGNPVGEAQTLGNLGNNYYATAQYSKAIAAYRQAQVAFREVGDRPSEVFVLTGLGNLYLVLNQLELALATYQETLKLAQQAQTSADPRQQQRLQAAEARSLLGIGVVQGSQQDLEPAIATLQRAIPLLRQSNDPVGESAALLNLGNAYLILGRSEQALTVYKQATERFQQINNPSGEARALIGTGLAYGSLDQPQRAVALIQQALPLLRQVGDRAGEAQALSNLGAALRAAGQLEEAVPTLQKSIQLLECVRAGLRDEQKVAIFEGQRSPYETLQRVLVDLERPIEALAVAERGRARAFVELIAQRGELPSNDGDACTPVNPLTLDEIRQIARTQQAYLVEYSLVGDRLYVWVVAPTGKISFRSTNLKALDVSFRELLGRDQADLVDRGIGDRTAVLTRLVSQGRRRIGTRDGFSFNAAPAANLARTIDVTQEAYPELQALHQLLIDPIADLLPQDEADRVIFLPQNELFLVPFPALQDRDGQFLVEKHTILTAPSIQVLALTREIADRKPDHTDLAKGEQVLIVGNPIMPRVPPKPGADPEQLSALPGAEEEAEAIAKLLNAQALLGGQATKPQVVAQMQSARLIHLATHGLLGEYGGGVPGAIALAPASQAELDPNDPLAIPPGLLTTREILALKLEAELVVLSACDSGLGRLTGDGVIGLSRSLISAGAPSVVVSLWSVPDDSTSYLMQQFYQNLKQGQNKAAALREAMLSTQKIFPDPRDWAAFTLIGEAE